MNYLERNKEQFLEELKGLIKIDSYLRDPEDYPNQKMVDAVNYLVELGNKEGFKTYAHPEGYYGYIEIGQGEKLIGMLGHVDVVPPGDDLDRWENNPFELTVDGDLLKGRGTQDDKGPVLLSFYLLKALVESGIELNYRIRLIFPTDEESFWRGVNKYIEDGQEIPTFGFTPDATFPIIYSERELYEFKIVGQPTTDFEIKAGAAINVVPDKATLKINGETFVEEGKASHAMAPWNGENAINKLLFKHELDHELVSFLKNEVNNEPNGETLFDGIISDDDSQLSVNFAVLNINDSKAEAIFDMRIPNTSSAEELKNKLIAKLEAKYPGLKFEHYDFIKGVFTPKDSMLLKSLLGSYQEVTGDYETQPIATGGATYARSMDNIVAFGPYFSDSPMTEHQYNEHSRFSDFVKAFDIFELAITKLNNN